jgi:hypothetical protein
MIFKEQLKAINACKEAIDWLGDKELQEAFATCERADWMLWAYVRLYPDNLRELTLAKGHCVNTVRNLMRDERSIKAVDAAILFGEGKISREELDAARDAAYAAACAADAAAADAADAAGAAGAARAAGAHAAAAADAAGAARAAGARAAAADAAAYGAARAAGAYAAAARDAAYTAARKQSLKEQADICRRYLTI